MLRGSLWFCPAACCLNPRLERRWVAFPDLICRDTRVRFLTHESESKTKSNLKSSYLRFTSPSFAKRSATSCVRAEKQCSYPVCMYVSRHTRHISCIAPTHGMLLGMHAHPEYLPCTACRVPSFGNQSLAQTDCHAARMGKRGPCARDK